MQRLANQEITEQLRDYMQAGQLILFVGNGVRRVPTHVADGMDLSTSVEGDLGPSWQSYMEKLWEFAQSAQQVRDDDLDFSAFSRLTAPRQAEWFDRRIDDTSGGARHLASMLRMHLLGLDLHPRAGIPTNSLLEILSTIAITSASNRDRGMEGIDLITTNVDCAIEQNIALAVERQLKISGVAPKLTVRTAQGHTATWRRGGAPQGPEIRIWKIHGCLGALKKKYSTWVEDRRNLVQQVPSMKEDRHQGFAGAVPTDELWPGSEWRNHVTPHVDTSIGVFSITEYVSLLDNILKRKLKILQDIFSHRPILFIGYDLHEVDVDIVVTLHRTLSSKSPRFTLRFRAEKNSDPHEEERLRQMGVHWWSFQLGPLASARLPGELRLTTRHEWRYGGKRFITSRDLRADLENPWRKRLQAIAAQEWLEAQETSLLELSTPAAPVSRMERSKEGARLVIAGLASMWHAFALKNSEDMPSRRRVSARLAAVDSEVPGGSGLVPAMVAAATVGPESVGEIIFLTNVGRQWSQWEEIEEFCLSAGIDVRPIEGNLDINAGARTSHVLLYDPYGKEEDKSGRPHQRMIMDVDELVDPNRGGSIERAAASQVRPVPGLGAPNHLLFADKLVSPDLLVGWKGPVIFETGSSGDELLDQIVAPAFWTAGFGSFIKTLVCARLGHKISGGRWQADLPQSSLGAAVSQLRDDSDLSVLVDQQPPGVIPGEYVAIINSFGRELWTEEHREKVSHEHELKYGLWMQKRWHILGDTFWRILDNPSIGRPLLTSNAFIGRGILTTLHEAGLMAHLELPNRGKCSVVINIETEKSEGTILRFVCNVNEPHQNSPTPRPVIFRIPPSVENETESTGLVIIPGAEAINIPLAGRIRRHTLGAGDTVRGCLAYGLWALAFEKDARRRPASLEHVLLASCFLASLKSYAGSFVEFLHVIEGFRGSVAWKNLWGFQLE